MKIDKFVGEYRFLSNFWPATVTDGVIIYPTVEHAYQAIKTLNLTERRKISQLPKPGMAKRYGKTVALREDWENLKIMFMASLLYQKFSSHPELTKKLIATGDVELNEGNHWGDTFWGKYNGNGENHLGKMLMDVRKSLKEEKKMETTDKVQLESMKGQPCLYKPIICQEGWCSGCQIYLDTLEEKK